MKTKLTKAHLVIIALAIGAGLIAFNWPPKIIWRFDAPKSEERVIMGVTGNPTVQTMQEPELKKIEEENTEKENTEIKPKTKPEDKQEPEQKTIEVYPVRDLVDDINEARTANGLQKLEIWDKLEQSSSIKAKEMSDDNYFAHANPNGEKFYTILKELNIKVNYSGENLARFDNPDKHSYKEFIDSIIFFWMTSTAGHKEVVLNEKYTKIGCSAYGIYVACHFSN